MDGSSPDEVLMLHPGGMTATVRSDPTELIPDAVEGCLDLAGNWLAWDGRG
jgi:hypothetical protein